MRVVRKYLHLQQVIGSKNITKEINKSSDINIEPEFKKQGRSITEIRFIITPNEQLPLMDIDDDAVKGTSVYKRLRALGIAHKLAQQWIITHGEDYVVEKLDYASLQRENVERAQSAAISAEKQYRYKLAQEAKTWLASLPQTKQDIVLDNFEDSLDKDYLRSDYHAKGLDASPVAGRFGVFYQEYNLS